MKADAYQSLTGDAIRGFGIQHFGQMISRLRLDPSFQFLKRGLRPGRRGSSKDSWRWRHQNMADGFQLMPYRAVLIYASLALYLNSGDRRI